MISFKPLSINNFIHGSRLMFDCHRVSGKAPEELLFLKMISHVLGAIALMTWVLFLGLEQIWNLLQCSATENSYEFNYFSLFLLWQKIVLNISLWCLIYVHYIQVSLFETGICLYPSSIHHPHPWKSSWKKKNNFEHRYILIIFILLMRT